jgi:tRNA pseudouridine38-40 synthase
MPAHARWRLDLSYDGASFHGFAVQPNVRTVAGVLGEAIARTVRLATAPHITCAGRTDAGVHAAAQVVHVDLPVTFDGDLARAITRQLEPLVVVARAERVSDTFDARHDAIERRYRYLIWNAATPDSASASRAWHVSAPLDLRAMRAAADTFLGERDFRAFCRRVPNTSPDDPVKRRVSDVSLYVIPWQCGAGPIVGDGLAYRVLATPPPPTPFEEGRMVAFEVAANAFCHQMVRSMVGALTAVGRGQMGAATVLGLLESGSRDSAPQPAPPHGLCLVAVTYP